MASTKEKLWQESLVIPNLNFLSLEILWTQLQEYVLSASQEKLWYQNLLKKKWKAWNSSLFPIYSLQKESLKYAHTASKTCRKVNNFSLCLVSSAKIRQCWMQHLLELSILLQTLWILKPKKSKSRAFLIFYLSNLLKSQW